MSFWCRAIPNERTAAGTRLPKQSDPGGGKYRYPALPMRREGSHGTEPAAVAAGGLVVAAHLDAGGKDRHHPLHEQPRGPVRVTQADEVTDAGTTAAHDDKPVAGWSVGVMLVPSTCTRRKHVLARVATTAAAAPKAASGSSLGRPAGGDAGPDRSFLVPG